MFHSTCEYLIRAKQKGILEEDLTFYPEKICSPYMECSPELLNQPEFEADKPIGVNPLYRYSAIFSRLFEPEYEDCLKDLKTFLFDFWIHEAYETERYSGMTRESFYRQRLLEELLEGVLGKVVTSDMLVFDKEQQDYLIIQLMKMYLCGEEFHSFQNTITKLFPNSYLYLLENRKILLYIGEQKNSFTSKKIEVLQKWFLPLGMAVDIYWDRHFGVVGVEETMILDELELY